MSKVIIIGGGASGMMAACAAAERGAEVILFEKNEKLGKKLYITGKGRCNVTNLCEKDVFLQNVVRNPRFLYSSLNEFTPRKLMEWLEMRGCPLEVERGNRVFPQSQKASDITRTFERELRRLRVKVQLNTKVDEILTYANKTIGVSANGVPVEADSVILSSGGCSYPSTGSDGDGWRWLSKTDHHVFLPRPSLTGLISDAEWVKNLQGVSLKNVTVTVRDHKKKLYCELGEMLFTHYGISGPLVLSASAYLSGLDFQHVTFMLDLKPALSREQLDARLLRDISQSPLIHVDHLLCGLYPQRLAETIGILCGLNLLLPCNRLTRDERQKIIIATKNLQIPVCGLCDLNEAIITRGGVDVREINPTTMQSKLISGLYIAGELLDVDALTGGFNLQIAFSTGYAAGVAAAEQI